MPPRGANEEHFRRRLVGLYALTLMEREGPVHGYRVSERIAERTEGGWRPGPGAVYPSLRQLAQSGFARPRLVGRRQVYSITPAGRQLLARVRSGREQFLRSKPDLGLLWAEVMGAEDVGGFLLLRLRRTLGTLEAHLGGPAPRSASLREQVLHELRDAVRRVERPVARAAPAPVR